MRLTYTQSRLSVDIGWHLAVSAFQCIVLVGAELQHNTLIFKIITMFSTPKINQISRVITY